MPLLLVHGFTGSASSWSEVDSIQLAARELISEAFLPVLSMGLPIVCPLRHPYWVEETWKRHGKDIGQLVECFYTLIDRLVRYGDAHIFVIDSDDREAKIRGLSEFIGEDFETDWQVVASKQNTHSLRLEDLSPSDEIMRLAEDEFFQKFYGRSRTEICS